MIKYLLSLLLLLPVFSQAAECTLYEKTHPAFILTGAHLSTGKCSTCASCHYGGVFNGTPKACIGCHNGDPARNAMYRSASHIPTALVECSNCHNTAAFKPATMSHTSVTSITCKSCHNGSYTTQGTQGALGQPSNHIPVLQLLNGASLDCNACHTSTTLWATQTMNHNATVGSGAGWCKGCHLRGTNYLGHGELMSLTHQQSNPVPLDCSQSNCHRPLGNKGSMYRKWDN
jgi:hypothetical protein